MATSVDERIDSTLRKFEREDLFNDIREAVKGALEDGYEDTNAGLERVENHLTAIEKKQDRIITEVDDLRKLITKEFSALGNVLSILSGVHDVSTTSSI